MQQVYKLNIPSFNDISVEKWNFLDNKEKYDYLHFTQSELSCFVKKQWLKLLDFEWNTGLFFKKNNTYGSCHSDLEREDDINKICVWGINWIFNGSGKIEYWDFQNAKLVGKTPGSLNRTNFGKVLKYSPLTKPNYVYEQNKDCVYLVNASLPHRAIGNENRCALSLRDYNSYSMKWKDIIEKFKDYIIYD
jgi:hypothetical protein